MTFTWVEKAHNVNKLKLKDFKKCKVDNPIATSGDHVWTAPMITFRKTFYFACGMGKGYHCRELGMRAMITVSNNCPY